MVSGDGANPAPAAAPSPLGDCHARPRVLAQPLVATVSRYLGPGGPRWSGRAQSRWVATLAWFFTVVLGLTACADASRRFTGVWRAVEPLDSTWLTGRPELAIGHFGRELTGVVHFLDDNGLPSQSCPCAFLDQRGLDLDLGTFVVTAEVCDAGIWAFEATLDENGADPALEVTVYRTDATSDRVTGRFVLEDVFVSDDRRECEP